MDIETSLQAIHLSDQKPTLEYLGKTKEIEDMLKEYSLNPYSVLAIVRCWNKSVDQLLTMLMRFEHFRTHLPLFNVLCIVVNKEKDEYEQTIKHLQHIFDTHSFSFHILLFRVERYTWTSGINGPLAFLHHLFQKHSISITYRHVLIQSFDVVFEEEKLQNMFQKLNRKEAIISIRQDSETLDSNLLNQLSDVMRQLIQQSSPDDAGLETFFERHKAIITLARNTSMIFRFNDLIELGGFNPWCNEQGGMEDHEFLIRLMLSYNKNNNEEEIKRFIRAINDPISYRDEAWDSKTIDQKKEKMNRELQAVIAITTHLKEWAMKRNGYQLPEAERDFCISSL